jgi:hypothetical protein
MTAPRAADLPVLSIVGLPDMALIKKDRGWEVTGWHSDSNYPDSAVDTWLSSAHGGQVLRVGGGSDQ